MADTATQRVDFMQGPVKSSQDAVEGMGKDMQTIQMVMALIKEGKANKKDVEKDWNKFKRFNDGKQWDTSNRVQRPIMNIMRPAVQTILPILTDTSPGFNVEPTEPDDFAFAEVLSKVAEAWWTKRDMDMELVGVLTDALELDGGILKVTWNPELEEGIGDVDARIVDPRDILVPNDARDINKDCPWLIHLVNKRVGKLKNQFPDKAHLIKADGKKTDDKSKDMALGGDVVLVSPVDRRSNVGAEDFTEKPDDAKTALVAEVWMDDDSVEEYVLENEEKTQSGKVIKKKKAIIKKKYPGGRLITFLPNQKVLLQDVNNPYKHQKKPFVRFVDTVRPRQFWGEGQSRHLIEPQKMFNKVNDVMFEWLKKASNPTLVVPKDSGINPQRITNRVAQVLVTNPGTEKPYWLIPPPIPRFVQDYMRIIKEHIEDVTGVQDVSQGRRPTGITSGDAIEELQEAAQTRIRLKERNLQTSLKQVAQLAVPLIMQFYREPRVIKIAGKDSRWPEFFEFFIEDVEVNKDGKPVGDGEEAMETRVNFSKQDFQMDEDNKRLVKDDNIQTGENPSRGIFDIRVETGTSLPFSRAKREATSFKLFDKQIIDARAVLDDLDYPGKEEVLKRKEEEAAAAAEAEGAPLPPGPPV